MLRDAELFRSRLSKLDGAGDVGDHIMFVVNSKQVAERAGPLDNVQGNESEAAAEIQSQPDGGSAVVKG